MNRTKLTMLPSQRYDSHGEIAGMERDGFVDESVVMALVAGPVQPRHPSEAEDLALSSNDMDFAGWSLPRKLPAVATAAVRPLIDEEIRRPAPPVLEEEPGLGEPHRGSHRWWLAGLAGALSTMLFSVLLLSLSSRERPEMEGFSIIRKPAKPQVDPALRANESKSVPELTDLTPVK